MALTTPRLPRQFFVRDPVVLARDLLGRVLFYKTPDGLLASVEETNAAPAAGQFPSGGGLNVVFSAVPAVGDCTKSIGQRDTTVRSSANACNVAAALP